MYTCTFDICVDILTIERNIYHFMLSLHSIINVVLCQDRQEFLTRWKKKQEFVAVNLYFDIGDGRLKLYKNKIHIRSI